MIRKVKFNNFYSFKKEQEISFLTSKKNSYSFVQSKAKENQQITKIAGLVGGNASGKTNTMRLFSFFGYFVCAERRGGDIDIAFKTFFGNKEKSDFYIEFEMDNAIYFYEFSIEENVIIREKLSEKRFVKNARKETIFLRNENKIKILHEKYFGDFPVKYLKSIRKDVSLMAFLKAHHSIEIIDKINAYFSNFYFNINEAGKRNHFVHNIRSIEAYLKDEKLKLQMENFIERFDLGLKGFKINKIDKSEEQQRFASFEIFGIHETEKTTKEIPFIYESRGTQSLFFLIAHIFNALKNNGIVIIDELETGLHPEAVAKIIDYFIDENEDGKAQLIFSSHALDFLKKFDMQQIFLVEKNKVDGSECYRLDDIGGIRSDENFLAKYMSGAYGSFPNIKV